MRKEKEKMKVRDVREDEKKREEEREWRVIGVRGRHSTSTPGADSPSSNTPVQVSFQENTQHQHKKFWIGRNTLKRVKSVAKPTVPADSG